MGNSLRWPLTTPFFLGAHGSARCGFEKKWGLQKKKKKKNNNNNNKKKKKKKKKEKEKKKKEKKKKKKKKKKSSKRQRGGRGARQALIHPTSQSPAPGGKYWYQ